MLTSKMLHSRCLNSLLFLAMHYSGERMQMTFNAEFIVKALALHFYQHFFITPARFIFKHLPHLWIDTYIYSRLRNVVEFNIMRKIIVFNEGAVIKWSFALQSGKKRWLDIFQKRTDFQFECSLFLKRELIS